MVVLREK